MHNTTKPANSQSVSAHMAKGNAGVKARMLANLKKMRDNTNHHFCPPLRSQGDADKTSAIYKALA